MEIKISKNNDHIIIDNKYQIKIVGTFDFPYFCGEDVCYMLGYDNMKDALEKHVGPRQKKMFSEFDENECTIGIPHFNDADTVDDSMYINILGFFHLAYYSSKAEEYQDAVFEDIFPAIRKREKTKTLMKMLLHVTMQLNDLMK